MKIFICVNICTDEIPFKMFFNINKFVEPKIPWRREILSSMKVAEIILK